MSCWCLQVLLLSHTSK
jgi:hypothetical protein